jgi:hypothetical protein
MLIKRSASFMVMLACLVLSMPQQGYSQQEQREILVPANLKLSLELLSPLSTATNQKGDKFNCSVLSPVEYASAVVSGYIRKAKRSGKEKGKSEMDLAFDTITLTDGRTGGFNATVVEVFDVVDAGNQGRADTEGLVKGRSTVKRDAVKIGAATAVGAIIGGILGGGKGAAIGAAIGAGVGVTSTLATSGPDLEFKQGTQFTVETNGPVRRKSTTASNNSTGEGTAGRPVLRRIQPTPEGAGSGSTPATPNSPSSQYRPYTGGNLFRLSIPDNWREFSGNNSVALAPDGGYISQQGRSDLTHGMMVGATRTQSQDLQQAAEQYVKALLQSNSYLRQQNGYQRGTVAGRSALVTTLAGRSDTTGRTEMVTIYLTMLRNGDLFYMIAIAPQDEYGSYSGTFQNVVRSLQIND